MKYFFLLPLVALAAMAVPAQAQIPMGGGMGGPGGAPAPQPKPNQPNIAPTGLPGVGAAPGPATVQKQRPIGGDPTQELFAAITKNDYASAQDAVSRGADLGAKDQFGETPLDLSIALNRNNITFLLLGTRNELAMQDGGGTMGAPWTLNGADGAPGKAKPGKPRPNPAIQPARAPALAPRYPAGDTGTPDPQAGFLGFGATP
ncbi:ankyrin repeat domain-containing protein [Acidocella sp.]|uniref:ankyrin repeat domain-containing protein n=1 Tax=Acidocella sp. TaxID=50710 RepID=UPI002606F6CA|nr:ankyrin repeat domain-containing protein [Acidocella sp.]